MKYLMLFIIVTVLLAGCSNSDLSPIKYMSDQSHLSLAQYDSVEYYKADKSIWNFPARDPFVAVLYFNDKQYQDILQQVRQDSSYYKVRDQIRKEKGYKVRLKQYSIISPNCINTSQMYVYTNYYEAIDFITIFGNRIYFKHTIKGPFD